MLKSTDPAEDQMIRSSHPDAITTLKSRTNRLLAWQHEVALAALAFGLEFCNGAGNIDDLAVDIHQSPDAGYVSHQIKIISIHKHISRKYRLDCVGYANVENPMLDFQGTQHEGNPGFAVGRRGGQRPEWH